MPKLSEQSKKLLQDRAGEVSQRTKENTAYRKGEAKNPAKYQEHNIDMVASRPVRKTEAGRYGDASHMLKGAGKMQDMKIHKALVESGTEPGENPLD